MDTTFASHNLLRRPRSHQAVFISLLALAIAAGAYGMIFNTSIATSSVGVGPARTQPNAIDQTFVDALARNYPPVHQAAAYRAAADLNKSAIDQTFVDALARNYPPVHQAAAYRAAADLNKSAIDQTFVDALARNYPPVHQAAAYRAAASVNG